MSSAIIRRHQLIIPTATTTPRRLYQSNEVPRGSAGEPELLDGPSAARLTAPRAKANIDHLVVCLGGVIVGRRQALPRKTRPEHRGRVLQVTHRETSSRPPRLRETRRRRPSASRPRPLSSSLRTTDRRSVTHTYGRAVKALPPLDVATSNHILAVHHPYRWTLAIAMGSAGPSWCPGSSWDDDQ